MRIFTIPLIASILCTAQLASAQAITEGFDNVSTLSASGWTITNKSSTTGTTSWYQGNSSVFSSQNGSSNSYIAADMNSVSGSGTISNWLIMPTRTLKTGDTISFYTRAKTISLKADRLQIRLSTSGTSSNVGSSATDVGDFGTILEEINASQVALAYPGVWTKYTIVLSGFSAPFSGRVAFRYFVTGAGSLGDGDYIGIDNFEFNPLPCPTITISPSSLPNGVIGTAYSQSFSQSGGVNPTTYSVTAGALPAGLSLSSSGVLSGTPTASATYNFTVTGRNTITGCTGARAYTFIVTCGTSTATLAPFTAVCSNEAPVTLTGGAPSGGSYTGLGISNGKFNPSAGTQTITYSYVDGNGCTNSASRVFTVKPAPTVSITEPDPVCSDALPFAVMASPAGGTFTGQGLSGNVFSPSAGSQSIKYVYTASNGCMDSSTVSITVNTAPVVSLDSLLPYACINDAPIELKGTPAGGTYSGMYIDAGKFVPSALGSYQVAYTYTDPNGCPGYATDNIEVINCFPTSVKKVAQVQEAGVVTCYPNPTTGTFNVKYDDVSGDVRVTIVDIQGKVVLTEHVTIISGGLNKSYDASVYPKGLYIIQVAGFNGAKAYGKVVVK